VGRALEGEEGAVVETERFLVARGETALELDCVLSVTAPLPEVSEDDQKRSMVPKLVAFAGLGFALGPALFLPERGEREEEGVDDAEEEAMGGSDLCALTLKVADGGREARG